MNENPCSNQEIHLLFEHGFELEYTLNEPRVICMTLYTESLADQTDHFADGYVRENVGYVVTAIFESLQLIPFSLEKSCVRKGIF